MSMNFSEFKELLGADPLNSDPEILAARNSNPAFEQAAREAQAFEQKLQSALSVVEPGVAFFQEIMSVAQQSAIKSWGRPRWFAIAASVLILIGVSAATMWQINQPKTIEEYVAHHYELDGLALIEKSSVDFDISEITSVLAKLNMRSGQALSDKIRFIRLCPTLEGRGAHMVVQSDRGEVTVIYMPGTMVQDRRIIEFGDMQAYMVAFESGTAAIIGHTHQIVSNLDQLVRSSLSSTI